jgi:hypothetical protein
MNSADDYEHAIRTAQSTAISSFAGTKPSACAAAPVIDSDVEKRNV